MELVEFKRQNVVVFRIPSTTYGKGYNLNDWKDMIWEGQILVISNG